MHQQPRDFEHLSLSSPKQEEMLQAGDVVKSSQEALQPKFLPVEASPTDALHVRTLDGKLILTAPSDDDILQLPLNASRPLKRGKKERGGKPRHLSDMV